MPIQTPATEIDHLQGEVVTLTERIGRVVPVNRKLVELVRAAEHRGKRDFAGAESGSGVDGPACSHAYPRSGLPRMLGLHDGVFRVLARRVVAIDPQVSHSAQVPIQPPRGRPADGKSILQGEVVTLPSGSADLHRSIASSCSFAGAELATELGLGL